MLQVRSKFFSHFDRKNLRGISVVLVVIYSANIFSFVGTANASPRGGDAKIPSSVTTLKDTSVKSRVMVKPTATSNSTPLPNKSKIETIPAPFKVTLSREQIFEHSLKKQKDGMFPVGASGRWKRTDMDTMEYQYLGYKYGKWQEDTKLVAKVTDRSNPGFYEVYAYVRVNQEWIPRHIVEIPSGWWTGTEFIPVDTNLVKKWFDTLHVGYVDDRAVVMDQIGSATTQWIWNQRKDFMDAASSYSILGWQPNKTAALVTINLSTVDRDGMIKQSSANQLVGAVKGYLDEAEGFENTGTASSRMQELEWIVPELAVDTGISRQLVQQTVDLYYSRPHMGRVDQAQGIASLNYHITKMRELCVQFTHAKKREDDAMGLNNKYYAPSTQQAMNWGPDQIQIFNKYKEIDAAYEELAQSGEAKEHTDHINTNTSLVTLWGTPHFEKSVGLFDSHSCTHEGEKVNLHTIDVHVVEKARIQLRKQQISKMKHAIAELKTEVGYYNRRENRDQSEDLLKQYAVSAPLSLQMALMQRQNVIETAYLAQLLRQIYKKEERKRYINFALLGASLALDVMSLGTATPLTIAIGGGAVASNAIYVYRVADDAYDALFLSRMTRKGLAAGQISFEQASLQLDSYRQRIGGDIVTGTIGAVSVALGIMNIGQSAIRTMQYMKQQAIVESENAMALQSKLATQAKPNNLIENYNGKTMQHQGPVKDWSNKQVMGGAENTKANMKGIKINPPKPSPKTEIMWHKDDFWNTKPDVDNLFTNTGPPKQPASPPPGNMGKGPLVQSKTILRDVSAYETAPYATPAPKTSDNPYSLFNKLLLNLGLTSESSKQIQAPKIISNQKEEKTVETQTVQKVGGKGGNNNSRKIQNSVSNSNGSKPPYTVKASKESDEEAINELYKKSMSGDFNNFLDSFSIFLNSASSREKLLCDAVYDAETDLSPEARAHAAMLIAKANFGSRKAVDCEKYYPNQKPLKDILNVDKDTLVSLMQDEHALDLDKVMDFFNQNDLNTVFSVVSLRVSYVHDYLVTLKNSEGKSIYVEPRILEMINRALIRLDPRTYIGMNIPGEISHSFGSNSSAASGIGNIYDYTGNYHGYDLNNSGSESFTNKFLSPGSTGIPLALLPNSAYPFFRSGGFSAGNHDTDLAQRHLEWIKNHERLIKEVSESLGTGYFNFHYLIAVYHLQFSLDKAIAKAAREAMKKNYTISQVLKFLEDARTRFEDQEATTEEQAIALKILTVKMLEGNLSDDQKQEIKFELEFYKKLSTTQAKSALVDPVQNAWKALELSNKPLENFLVTSLSQFSLPTVFNISLADGGSIKVVIPTNPFEFNNQLGTFLNDYPFDVSIKQNVFDGGFWNPKKKEQDEHFKQNTKWIEEHKKEVQEALESIQNRVIRYDRFLEICRLLEGNHKLSPTIQSVLKDKFDMKRIPEILQKYRTYSTEDQVVILFGIAAQIFQHSIDETTKNVIRAELDYYTRLAVAHPELLTPLYDIQNALKYSGVIGPDSRRMDFNPGADGQVSVIIPLPKDLGNQSQGGQGFFTNSIVPGINGSINSPAPSMITSSLNRGFPFNLALSNLPFVPNSIQPIMNNGVTQFEQIVTKESVEAWLQAGNMVDPEFNDKAKANSAMCEVAQSGSSELLKIKAIAFLLAKGWACEGFKFPQFTKGFHKAIFDLISIWFSTQSADIVTKLKNVLFSTELSEGEKKFLIHEIDLLLKHTPRLMNLLIQDFQTQPSKAKLFGQYLQAFIGFEMKEAILQLLASLRSDVYQYQGSFSEIQNEIQPLLKNSDEHIRKSAEATNEAIDKVRKILAETKKRGGVGIQKTNPWLPDLNGTQFNHYFYFPAPVAQEPQGGGYPTNPNTMYGPVAGYGLDWGNGNSGLKFFQNSIALPLTKTGQINPPYISAGVFSTVQGIKNSGVHNQSAPTKYEDRIAKAKDCISRRELNLNYIIEITQEAASGDENAKRLIREKYSDEKLVELLKNLTGLDPDRQIETLNFVNDKILAKAPSQEIIRQMLEQLLSMEFLVNQGQADDQFADSLKNLLNSVYYIIENNIYGANFDSWPNNSNTSLYALAPSIDVEYPTIVNSKNYAVFADILETNNKDSYLRQDRSISGPSYLKNYVPFVSQQINTNLNRNAFLNKSSSELFDNSFNKFNPSIVGQVKQWFSDMGDSVVSFFTNSNSNSQIVGKGLIRGSNPNDVDEQTMSVRELISKGFMTHPKLHDKSSLTELCEMLSDETISASDADRIETILSEEGWDCDETIYGPLLKLKKIIGFQNDHEKLDALGELSEEILATLIKINRKDPDLKLNSNIRGIEKIVAELAKLLAKMKTQEGKSKILQMLNMIDNYGRGIGIDSFIRSLGLHGDVQSMAKLLAHVAQAAHTYSSDVAEKIIAEVEKLNNRTYTLAHTTLLALQMAKSHSFRVAHQVEPSTDSLSAYPQQQSSFWYNPDVYQAQKDYYDRGGVFSRMVPGAPGVWHYPDYKPGTTATLQSSTASSNRGIQGPQEIIFQSNGSIFSKIQNTIGDFLRSDLPNFISSINPFSNNVNNPYPIQVNPEDYSDPSLVQLFQSNQITDVRFLDQTKMKNALCNMVARNVVPASILKQVNEWINRAGGCGKEVVRNYVKGIIQKWKDSTKNVATAGSVENEKIQLNLILEIIQAASTDQFAPMEKIEIARVLLTSSNGVSDHVARFIVDILEKLDPGLKYADGYVQLAKLVQSDAVLQQLLKRLSIDLKSGNFKGDQQKTKKEMNSIYVGGSDPLKAFAGIFMNGGNVFPGLYTNVSAQNSLTSITDKFPDSSPTTVVSPKTIEELLIQNNLTDPALNNKLSEDVLCTIAATHKNENVRKAAKKVVENNRWTCENSYQKINENLRKGLYDLDTLIILSRHWNPDIRWLAVSNLFIVYKSRAPLLEIMEVIAEHLDDSDPAVQRLANLIFDQVKNDLIANLLFSSKKSSILSSKYSEDTVCTIAATHSNATTRQMAGILIGKNKWTCGNANSQIKEKLKADKYDGETLVLLLTHSDNQIRLLALEASARFSKANGLTPDSLAVAIFNAMSDKDESVSYKAGLIFAELKLNASSGLAKKLGDKGKRLSQQQKDAFVNAVFLQAIYGDDIDPTIIKIFDAVSDTNFKEFAFDKANQTPIVPTVNSTSTAKELSQKMLDEWKNNKSENGAALSQTELDDLCLIKLGSSNEKVLQNIDELLSKYSASCSDSKWAEVDELLKKTEKLATNGESVKVLNRLGILIKKLADDDDQALIFLLNKILRAALLSDEVFYKGLVDRIRWVFYYDEIFTVEILKFFSESWRDNGFVGDDARIDIAVNRKEKLNIELFKQLQEEDLKAYSDRALQDILFLLRRFVSNPMSRFSSFNPKSDIVLISNVVYDKFLEEQGRRILVEFEQKNIEKFRLWMKNATDQEKHAFIQSAKTNKDSLTVQQMLITLAREDQSLTIREQAIDAFITIVPTDIKILRLVAELLGSKTNSADRDAQVLYSKIRDDAWFVLEEALKDYIAQLKIKYSLNPDPDSGIKPEYTDAQKAHAQKKLDDMPLDSEIKNAILKAANYHSSKPNILDRNAVTYQARKLAKILHIEP